MTTHSENTATINFPIEKVHQALSTRAYWDHEVATIGDEPGKVNEFADNPVKAELFELLPKDALPEAVRGFVSQDLKLKRVVSMEALDGNKASGQISADVKGAPVSISGDLTLTGEGDKTTLTTDSAVNVKIPMMGSVLEPKVAEWLGAFLDREASILEKWIGENL